MFHYMLAQTKLTKILSLSAKKSTAKVDISAKVLKDSMNIYRKEWTILMNACFKKRLFCDELK